MKCRGSLINAMEQDPISRAIGYLSEAFETGNPLAPLPAEIAPATRDDAEEVAGGVLARLGFAPCGIRVAPAADGSLITGPMLEARFLDDGAGLALEIMRHGRASAALLGVLGAALEPEATTPPEITAIHPALDVSASRFTRGPADHFAEIADLAGLGLLVLGKRRPAPARPARVALVEGEASPRGTPFDLQAAFAMAAAEARRLGGLPAGAVLVVAGLGGSVMGLKAGARLTARFTGIGKVSASFG
jgi:2-keto-4-pentenoate hydratase